MNRLNDRVIDIIKLRQINEADENLLRQYLHSLKTDDLVDIILTGAHEFNKYYNIIKKREKKIPQLDRFSIYGKVIPFNGLLGGDSLEFINFKTDFDLKKRKEHSIRNVDFADKNIADLIRDNENKIGILIVDASGHDVADSAFSRQFVDSFSLGAQFELSAYGHITLNLFEELNIAYAKSAAFRELFKYFTVKYLEVENNGIIKYFLAAHPPPIIYSNEKERIMDIDKEYRKIGGIMGHMPSRNHVDAATVNSGGYKEDYTLNTIELYSPGDILIMHSDGLTDIENDSGESYFGMTEDKVPLENTPLERKLNELKHLNKDLKAKTIWDRIYQDILRFQSNLPDDLTFVVVKKEY